MIGFALRLADFARLMPYFGMAVCLLAGGLWAGEKPSAKAGDEGRRIWAVMTWEIRLAEGTERFELLALLPRPLPGRQVVHGLYSSAERSALEEADGNLYARWDWRRGQGEHITLMVAVEVTLFAATLNGSTGGSTGSGARAHNLSYFQRRRYTAAETKIETEAHLVRQAAEEVSEGVDELETARNIMNYVSTRISYGGFSAKDGGALAALRSGTGDCTDYVDLFVALCRVKGIPARHVSGVLTRWINVPGHSWAEFHVPGRGWLALDPLHIEQGSAAFGEMDAKYLRLSVIRNDSRLGGGMLYRWRTEGAGGALVNFTVVEHADSPLQTLSDIRWSRIQ